MDFKPRNQRDQSISELRYTYSARNLWSGFLFGIGLVAFIDEAIFHQLLHWHHFYDKSTTSIGLISDGLFHALSWFATVGSLFMFADLRRRKGLWLKRWIGEFCSGQVLSSYMTESSSTSSCASIKSVTMSIFSHTT